MMYTTCYGVPSCLCIFAVVQLYCTVYVHLHVKRMEASDGTPVSGHFRVYTWQWTTDRQLTAVRGVQV